MTIILDNYPPLHPPAGRLGGCKNPRIIVAENALSFLREFLKALEMTTAMRRRKISCSPLAAIVELLTRHFTAAGSELL